jgi:hypothetical protein
MDKVIFRLVRIKISFLKTVLLVHRRPATAMSESRREQCITRQARAQDISPSVAIEVTDSNSLNKAISESRDLDCYGGKAGVRLLILWTRFCRGSYPGQVKKSTRGHFLPASLAVVLLAGFCCNAAPAHTIALQTRGYYMTFMRMPTFGLPQWKQMVDCIAEDGGNTLLLWTAGGFRSKKFPITWQYNRTHKNVENDFVRELIDYAHGKGIKVLLCFSPFCYDGVNQYPLEHPELKARQKNGASANYL